MKNNLFSFFLKKQRIDGKEGSLFVWHLWFIKICAFFFKGGKQKYQVLFKYPFGESWIIYEGKEKPKHKNLIFLNLFYLVPAIIRILVIIVGIVAYFAFILLFEPSYDYFRYEDILSYKIIAILNAVLVTLGIYYLTTLIF